MARETGRATHESGRLPEIPDPDVHLNRGVRPWMRRSGERTSADGLWIVRANAPARPLERVMGYALAAIVPSPLAAYTVHASHCVASVRQSWAPGGTFVVSGF
jgi:hypothetical protein